MVGWTVRNTTDLNMRQGPGTGYSVIMRLPTGTLMQILSEEGKWFQVVAGGQQGFVHSDYIEFPDVVKTTADLSVYQQPQANDFALTTVPADTYLSMFEEQGDWLLIVAWGQLGYIDKSGIEVSRKGMTTSTLNLRRGPGVQYAVVETLAPNTPVYIWNEVGEWYQIADTIHAGYVHREFVQLEGQGAPPGFIGGIQDAPVTSDESMEPVYKIEVPAGTGRIECQVAGIWNRVGGLLTVLSERLKIDPATAIAVLAVESGGRAFATDGRMIIRFENQIFFDKWGRENTARYSQHFRYNPDSRWLDHYWRPAVSEAWRECHQGQAGEWEVFNFACTLDETAAKLAISMGGAQIMGFNYALVGYESVHQMFDAFARSERSQIVGLFDFIQGPGTSSRRVLALQKLDFEGFAAVYNGPGQAARYGGLIREFYNAFKRLVG
ncbi:MAG: DUF3380 domain-containing protein [Anaerolineae bacterium]|nr:DUF3380 domain-containing protein [Anaerolineae bacterium]